MLYIWELCEDCTIANEIDYEIDYAWTSIHDNGHVITACDVVLQQRIASETEEALWVIIVSLISGLGYYL